MSKDPQSSNNLSPFERFKAAVSKVMAVPKADLPKTPKKPRKK